MGLFGWRSAKKEISAQELRDMLARDAAVLVDVREPDEFAAGHIKGAINLPLSRFDPAMLPQVRDKAVILQCAGGKRSGMALDQCGRAQSSTDTHLTGGIGAWKAAGFPIVQG